MNVTNKKAIKQEDEIRKKLEVELGEETLSELEEGNKLDETLWKTADRITKEELEMVGSGK